MFLKYTTTVMVENKVVDCPSIAPSTFNLYQFEIEQKKNMNTKLSICN